MKMVDPYNACVVQCAAQDAPNPNNITEIKKKNLKHMIDLLDYGGNVFGKLVVFPEFIISGLFNDGAAPHQDWMKIGINIPGEETDKLAERAKALNIYLVAHSIEVDDEWPNRFFSCAFILDPNGKVILKYRKNHCINLDGFYTVTTPSDVYTEYTKKYGGPQSLYPVVDTPIGRLGAFICYDMMFPEVARYLALQGAEVMIQVSDEEQNSNPLYHSVKQVRALENVAYLISANPGGYTPDSRMAVDSARGESMIINYDGTILRKAGLGEVTIHGPIDIEALRKRRRAVHPYNFLSHLKTATIAPIYQSVECCPVDLWASKPMEDTKEGLEQHKNIAKKLTEKNIY